MREQLGLVKEFAQQHKTTSQWTAELGRGWVPDVLLREQDVLGSLMEGLSRASWSQARENNGKF